MNDNLTIEVPVYYLLQIATHGKMGTGDLPDIMRTWATKKLLESGYNEELRKAQDEKLDQLRKSLSNVVGKEGMRKIDDALSDAKIGLDFAIKLHNKKEQ